MLQMHCCFSLAKQRCLLCCLVTVYASVVTKSVAAAAAAAGASSHHLSVCAVQVWAAVHLLQLVRQKKTAHRLKYGYLAWEVRGLLQRIAAHSTS